MPCRPPWSLEALRGARGRLSRAGAGVGWGGVRRTHARGPPRPLLRLLRALAAQQRRWRAAGWLLAPTAGPPFAPARSLVVIRSRLRGAALSNCSLCLSCNPQTRRREANSSLWKSCLAKGKRKARRRPGRRLQGASVALPRVSAMGPSLPTRRPWRTAWGNHSHFFFWPSAEFRGGEWGPEGGRAASSWAPLLGRWRTGVRGALCAETLPRGISIRVWPHFVGEHRDVRLHLAALAGGGRQQLTALAQPKLLELEETMSPCPIAWQGGRVVRTLGFTPALRMQTAGAQGVTLHAPGHV